MRDSICVLSGGTGTPKLLQGMVRLVEPSRLKIVVNTADDVLVGDLYISPDVDAVLYTLAGIIDEDKWYGIRGDTYEVHEERLRSGHADVLRVGDLDRANAGIRTRLLRAGRTLSDATQELRRRLGVLQEVWPMTDSRVVSKIITPGGTKDFQDYWVRDGGRDEVLGVEFAGIDEAVISDGARNAIKSSSAVVIGPSNPVTSIGPIIETRGVRELLADVQVVAISPLRGRAPFSGPAGRMLEGLGYEVSPVALAEMYGEFLDDLIIDTEDEDLRDVLSSYGIRIHLAHIRMSSPEDKFKLAQTALAACNEGERHGR